MQAFFDLKSKSQAKRVAALERIAMTWDDGDTGMMLESARFSRDRRTRAAIVDVLREQTGQEFGLALNPWYRWLWNRDVTPHPAYASFKKKLYSRIDPRFAEYFSDNYDTTIRLDEIRWGGVRRDGIPPLKNPETIPAADATYLADSDVVFGVEFVGRARAYPKRILAWHEMVKDVVGGRAINGVYCTLCGSMIVYDPEHEGTHYELGTSGFLYRSNKLMYDHATNSMWSTLRGKPVVGPLLGKDIQLDSLHVVTTTWGKWRKQHPDTDVLSLKTGHRRDYGEGVAYAKYFAIDDLMFTVPRTDDRLLNKDEVLVIRDAVDPPLVIAEKFLREHPVYHNQTGGTEFVVLTDVAGANRVYQTGPIRIAKWTDDETVVDSDGRSYRVTEDALFRQGASGSVALGRLSAHRAFWFGWFAEFPETKLIK